MVIWTRHSGQLASRSATRRAQLSRRRVRAWPHGTKTNPCVLSSVTLHKIPLGLWIWRWWRCHCRRWNLSFLRLVAAAAAIFCWTQYLCVFPWNDSQLTETAFSVSATAESGHACNRDVRMILRYINFLSLFICLYTYLCTKPRPP